MFGFIIGVAASVGAYAYFRGHRFSRRGFGGEQGSGDCHYGGHHRRGHHRRGRGSRGGWGRGGPSRWAEKLADLVDASPEQEDAIRSAIRELSRDLKAMRGEFKGSRRDIAGAFGSERLDEERLGELFTRHDERLTDARKSVVGALAKIHGALDPEQRERLAGWLDRRGGDFGPYRAQGA